jgi:hypothetical protein
MSWPHAYLGDEKARLPSFFEFLERITIDEPIISAGGTSIPFLHPRSQFLSRPNPEAPLSAIELTCEAFEREFFHSWLFRPFPYERCSLVEYDQLLNALRDRKRVGPQRRNPLLSLLAQGATLELAGQQYSVPRDWKTRLSSTVPPSEVARLLLAKRWGHDPQAVKEILVRLRKEAPIASAWTTYKEYLHQDPTKLREVYLIVSREPSAIGWPRTWPVPESATAP